MSDFLGPIEELRTDQLTLSNVTMPIKGPHGYLDFSGDVHPKTEVSISQDSFNFL